MIFILLVCVSADFPTNFEETGSIQAPSTPTMDIPTNFETDSVDVTAKPTKDKIIVPSQAKVDAVDEKFDAMFKDIEERTKALKAQMAPIRKASLEFNELDDKLNSRMKASSFIDTTDHPSSAASAFTETDMQNLEKLQASMLSMASSMKSALAKLDQEKYTPSSLIEEHKKWGFGSNTDDSELESIADDPMGNADASATYENIANDLARYTATAHADASSLKAEAKAEKKAMEKEEAAGAKPSEKSAKKSDTDDGEKVHADSEDTADNLGGNEVVHIHSPFDPPTPEEKKASAIVDSNGETTKGDDNLRTETPQ